MSVWGQSLFRLSCSGSACWLRLRLLAPALLAGSGSACWLRLRLLIGDCRLTNHVV